MTREAKSLPHKEENSLCRCHSRCKAIKYLNTKKASNITARNGHSDPTGKQIQCGQRVQCGPAAHSLKKTAVLLKNAHKINDGDYTTTKYAICQENLSIY